jgi:putative membrane protein
MHFSKYSFRLLCLGLCLGLATSCARREDSETAITTDSNISTTGTDQHMGGDTANHSHSGNTTAGMDFASMSDGNIIAWMGMADSMEVAMANMAKTKAQHAEVKKFAQMMATDHAKMKKEGQALAAKHNITPQTPSAQLNAYEMMTQHSDLTNATGRAFDSLYIASQVAMHQHVLDNMSNLKPQNAELKAAIDKAKPHIQKHLEEARRIQVALSAAQ